ncbi:hypothetical protein GGG16DRAFT_45653, partial [Schizophyllum commune]
PLAEFSVDLLSDQKPLAAPPLTEDLTLTEPSPPHRRPTLARQQGPGRLASRLLRYVPMTRRALRLYYVLIGVLVMLAWVGLILAFARFESKSEELNQKVDSQKYRGIGWDSSRDEIWILQGELRKLESEARKLTVQWSAFHYFPENKTSVPLIVPKEYFSEGVSMYRDIQAVIDWNLSNSTDYDGGYFFKLDDDSAHPIGNVGLREWDSFDTDIDLTDVKGDSVWTQPMRGYPFDQWTGSIVIASLMRQQNSIGESRQLTNTTTSLALSFDGITLEDSLLNWRINAQSYCTCDDPDSDYCDLRINFRVRRPTIVKFIVTAVVLVNWLSTLAIFFLTGEPLLLRRMRVVNDTDILGVLFASLFALPGVRALLPDAPPFGCTIDLVGILPNVIIISLCAFIWACMKLNARFIGERDDNEGKPSLRDEARTRRADQYPSFSSLNPLMYQS